MKTYLAQTYGPRDGYAYELSGLAIGDATSDEWETVIVDRDDFGAEVGVAVIDGVEMYVWERAEKEEA